MTDSRDQDGTSGFIPDNEYSLSMRVLYRDTMDEGDLNANTMELNGKY